MISAAATSGQPVPVPNTPAMCQCRDHPKPKDAHGGALGNGGQSAIAQRYSDDQQADRMVRRVDEEQP
jgi:hypothetical protein